jgi:hypothetical protein
MITVDQTRSRPWTVPGHRLILLLFVVLAGFTLSPPSIAQTITVASPIGATSDASPIWVRARNNGCDGLSPTVFGYSIDESGTFFRSGSAYDIDSVLPAVSAGNHTLHFKSWAHGHLCQVVSRSFSVGPPVTQDITVAEPVPGTNVASPLRVRAHNVGCDGMLPDSFGYSIDNESHLYLGVTAYDIDVTSQVIAAGSHTIHFKSWVRGHLCPVVNTAFVVSSVPSQPIPIPSPTPTPIPTPIPTPTPTPSAPPPTPTDYIPSTALVSTDLENSSNWEYRHDPGTPGSATGSTVFPATTPSSDTGREFYVTYSYGGGEIYHVSFGKDPNATHFVYDTYIYVDDPSQIENIEMDMNQVMANGDTVIFGTQCSSYSGTWEYTSSPSGNSHWSPSNIPCSPKKWAANSWHHVQIASHRDSSGNVTYDWVNLDGVHSDFQNATGPSARPLGWVPGDLLINFQLDGDNVSSGSITTFLHTLNIYRW